MADARLELAVGDLRFCAEGSEKWVDEKHAEFLSKIAELAHARSSASDKNHNGPSRTKAHGEEKKPSGTLATFLRDHNAVTKQVTRFLATAVWLQQNGAEILKTADVAKALTDARQQPLPNPADVLNKNVTKGFCVKSGDGFYVTPEGEESLKS